MQTIKEYEKSQSSWEKLLKPKRRVIGILPKQELPTQLMRKINQEPYLLAEREVSQLFELSDMINPDNEDLVKVQSTRERFESELREMYPSLDWDQDRNSNGLKLKSERVGNLRGMDRVFPKIGKERKEKSKLNKKSK